MIGSSQSQTHTECWLFSWFSCHIFRTHLFQENHLLYFHTRLLLNMLISLTSLLVVCSANLRGHRQISHTEVGLLAGFLAISFKCRCFRRIAFIYFHAFMMPKPLVSLTSQLEAYSTRTTNQQLGFLARFHAISGTQLFQENHLFHLLTHVTPKLLVSLTSQLEAYSARLRGHRQTERQAGRELPIEMCLLHSHSLKAE